MSDSHDLCRSFLVASRLTARYTPPSWLLTKKPNARLIAAAPELLVALQAMVAFALKHPSKDRCGVLYDATAAIAKAVQS